MEIRANPSPLDNMLCPPLFKALSNKKNNNIIVANIENKKSLVITCLFAFNLQITALVPKTINKLNMFEPITFETANSFDPFMDAIVLTTASGALVPNATIVKPIINVGIFNVFARFELPSTKKSAPFIKRINPIINNIKFILSP